MRRRRGAASRPLLVGLALAVLAGGVGVPAGGVGVPAAMAEKPPRVPQICKNEINASQRMRADIDALETDGTLGLDGRTIVVRGADANWRPTVTGDQTFITRFHSMAWLVPAVLKGFPAVDLLLERDAALPDPGSARGKGALPSTGWTEGAVRLRMGTVNCLFEITHDERLVPVMERLVLAAADPYRYRGLPLKKVHNHGALSNIMMAESAKVFGRDDWWQLALRRFSDDVAGVFSDCGMSAEQSAPYQLLNTELWQRSLRLMQEEGSRSADAVVEALERASLATFQLARPDGIIEAIGDGNEKTVDPRELGVDTSSASTRLWCSGRGWAANRSSWDDSTTHYVLRFGPRVAMHGHEDHGSVTWFTQGVPVFSDRGLYDKARGARYEWAHSMAAHTTFEPVGVDATGEMKARNLASGRLDRYELTWAQDGVSSTREISIPLDPVLIPTTVDDTTVPPPTDDTTIAGTDDTAVLPPTADDTPVMVPMTTLRIDDLGRSRRDQQWMQNWQLAPGWTVLDRTSPWEPAAYHEASGLYLYGTCWSSQFMRPTPTDREAFPAWRTPVPVTSFVCGGLGREVRMDTLWAVSPLKGTLSWDRVTGATSIAPPPPLPPLPPIPAPPPA